MKKRFFYAASADSDNAPEIRMSGVVDTKEPISVDKLITFIQSDLEAKGIIGSSVHIIQLNFLMDLPEE